MPKLHAREQASLCNSRLLWVAGWATIAESFVPFAGLDALRPRRLSELDSEPLEGSLRRFRHAVNERTSDGGTVTLQYELDVDPDLILSLDTERAEGLEVASCPEDSGLLQLHVPDNLVWQVREGAFVVGSPAAHACHDTELFRRILSVEGLEEQRPGSWFARLHTEEVSHAHVARRTQLSFSYMPPADLPSPRARKEEEDARRLNIGVTSSGGLGDTHNILSADPEQASNFGWNWEFDLTPEHDLQYQHSFPGGEGRVALIEPSITAQAGITLNVTSEYPNIRQAPHVHLRLGVHGDAHISGKAVMQMTMNDMMSGDPMNRWEIPFLDRLRNTVWGPNISFSIGSLPVSFSPGISFAMRAYHVGRFNGTLQLGVDTSARIEPTLVYDTIRGLDVGLDLELVDVRFWPPSWLIYARHFEIGFMLEPKIWLRGSVGGVHNAELGLGIKPYINASISRDGAHGAFPTEETRPLIAYPFRVTGLPAEGVYAVGVAVGGALRISSAQYNFGTIEYHDHADQFTFNPMTSDALIDNPIIVSILRDGQQPALAEVQVRCTALVGDACTDLPLRAELFVEGRHVVIELLVEWRTDPLPWFLSQVQDISLRIKNVNFSPGATTQVLHMVENTSAHDTFSVGFQRGGHTFSTTAQMNDDFTQISSNTEIQLGLMFYEGLRNWQAGQSPIVNLLLGSSLLANGTLPSVNWETAEVTGLGNDRSIEVHIGLFGNGGSFNVGTALVEIISREVSRGSFFIFPFQAGSVPVGSTKALVWTAPSLSTGAVTFNLTAVRLLPDMTTTEIPGFSAIISGQCDHESSPEAAAAGYANLGLYCHLVPFDAPFEAGTAIMLRLTWAAGGTLHDMYSPVVVLQTDPSRLYAVTAPSRPRELLERGQPLRVGWALDEGHIAADKAKAAELGLGHMVQSLYEVQGDSAEEPASAAERPRITSVSIERRSGRTVWSGAVDEEDSSLLVPSADVDSWPEGSYEVRLVWGGQDGEQVVSREFQLGPRVDGSAPPRLLTGLDWAETDIDWHNRMGEFERSDSDCTERPLRYAIGAGVLVKGEVKNFRIPGNVPLLGGLGSSGINAQTRDMPITQVSFGNHAGGHMAHWLCRIGMCEGSLPGCPALNPDPVEIPRIELQLSRGLHWHNHSAMVIRNIIAYMLAALPEALTVLATANITGHGPLLPRATSRRLAEASEQWVDKVSFWAHVPFRVDEELVGALLSRDALRLEMLDDGHNSELGRVRVTGFEVFDGELPPVSGPDGAERGSALSWGMAVCGGLLVVATLSRRASRKAGWLKVQQDAEACESAEDLE